MLIIPSIDILRGKVVRLAQGDFKKVTNYEVEPIEQAKLFESYGYKHLHIVDLLGSKCGEITTLKIIDEIKKRTKLSLQFGGGIRSYQNVKILMEHKINKVVIGSLSINQKNEFEKVIKDFGADKITIAADALNGKIMVKGWTVDSGISLFDHIEYCSGLGVKNFLCTDISQDGMLDGPSVGLYEKIMKQFPNINLTASGGVSSMANVNSLIAINMHSAIIGRAFYENKLNPKELVKIGK
ncbi:MAG: 1-(5-phosphoribosyl)-5-[(5-phosphoribosylamino)methylideneamino]imidazole-4-carboxamide isomerase [Bacteroidetes bacterium]|nr:1-(5-phosphoribosyl)-5-[(5-phosphoribosylamino)methylideneamino]imidazole-4-carboxamide isomerase [Bacteroidota bacterium]